jgi:hypothetical protein
LIETPIGVAQDRVSLKDHVATVNLPRVRAQSRKAPTDEVSSVRAHWTDGDAAFGVSPTQDGSDAASRPRWMSDRTPRAVTIRATPIRPRLPK